MSTNKLVETMKALIVAARDEGYTPREAIQVMIRFIDVLEASGVPLEVLHNAGDEVVLWMDRTMLAPVETQLDAR